MTRRSRKTGSPLSLAARKCPSLAQPRTAAERVPTCHSRARGMRRRRCRARERVLSLAKEGPDSQIGILRAPGKRTRENDIRVAASRMINGAQFLLG